MLLFWDSKGPKENHISHFWETGLPSVALTLIFRKATKNIATTHAAWPLPPIPNLLPRGRNSLLLEETYRERIASGSRGNKSASFWRSKREKARDPGSLLDAQQK